MKPYRIFPKRISHHAVAEQLTKTSLTYPELQSRIQEVVHHGHDIPGNRVGYIHHPFCEKLCKFCAFYKVLKDEDALARFLDVLNDRMAESIIVFDSLAVPVPKKLSYVQEPYSQHSIKCHNRRRSL